MVLGTRTSLDPWYARMFVCATNSSDLTTPAESTRTRPGIVFAVRTIDAYSGGVSFICSISPVFHRHTRKRSVYTCKPFGVPALNPPLPLREATFRPKRFWGVIIFFPVSPNKFRRKAKTMLFSSTLPQKKRKNIRNSC